MAGCKASFGEHDPSSCDEPQRFTIMFVGERFEQRSRFRELLACATTSAFELQEVSTLEAAIALSAVSKPAVMVLDARGGQWPAPEILLHLSSTTSLVFIVDAGADSLRAFDCGAIDCLVSLTDRDRLARALERVQDRLLRARLADSEEARDPGHDSEHAVWLRFASGGELVVAKLVDVWYFQANLKVTRVVLSGFEGSVRMGFNAVVARLDTRDFWRIHRGTIVNGHHVRAVQHDDLGRVSVSMNGRAETLFVSRVHERRVMREGLF
jgi:DNA-binding LytR/AlgR family response regulator